MLIECNRLDVLSGWIGRLRDGYRRGQRLLRIQAHCAERHVRSITPSCTTDNCRQLISLSSYRYNVEEDGTWSSRKLFAFVTPGIPDGIHCDSEGNVYAGVGDGVHVWNTSGTLLGKIFVGETSANFNFAGDGRMVICAETRLYYATIKAKGGFVASEMPGCCGK